MLEVRVAFFWGERSLCWRVMPWVAVVWSCIEWPANSRGVAVRIGWLSRSAGQAVSVRRAGGGWHAFELWVCSLKGLVSERDAFVVTL